MLHAETMAALFVYPRRLGKLLTEIQSLPKKKHAFIRLVTSRASECEFDKLGRINIPLVLRQEGQLEKECVIVGK